MLLKLVVKSCLTALRAAPEQMTIPLNKLPREAKEFYRNCRALLAQAQSENRGLTAMLGWSGDAFTAAGGCCKCCCCCCCKGAARARAKRDTACAAARGNAKCMSCWNKSIDLAWPKLDQKTKTLMNKQTKVLKESNNLQYLYVCTALVRALLTCKFFICTILWKNLTTKHACTGGPPLTQKSLTRFPLPRFFAYVRASGGIFELVGDPQSGYREVVRNEHLVVIIPV